MTELRWPILIAGGLSMRRDPASIDAEGPTIYRREGVTVSTLLSIGGQLRKRGPRGALLSIGGNPAKLPDH